jgi:hypothetical protein
VQDLFQIRGSHSEGNGLCFIAQWSVSVAELCVETESTDGNCKILQLLSQWAASFCRINQEETKEQGEKSK